VRPKRAPGTRRPFAGSERALRETDRLVLLEIIDSSLGVGRVEKSVCGHSNCENPRPTDGRVGVVDADARLFMEEATPGLVEPLREPILRRFLSLGCLGDEDPDESEVEDLLRIFPKNPFDDLLDRILCS